mgnify:CR=1 FL=1
MAKDLIIGAYANYKFDLLKPWINSIKETGFQGDIVLIAIDPDQHKLSLSMKTKDEAPKESEKAEKPAKTEKSEKTENEQEVKEEAKKQTWNSLK